MILGRPVAETFVEDALAKLKGERILVTGANGSIGSVLVPMLRGKGVPPENVWSTDLETLDVTDDRLVSPGIEYYKPSLIFHLAADKHAPKGEEEPGNTALINIAGTEFVLEAAARVGAKVVMTSTCKACEPETAYGASKLIAERMVLNAGGTVARLYNVVETQGNVFRLWEALAEDEPLPVMECERYFLSIDEAVALTLWAAVLPSGRYVADPGLARNMVGVALELYPGRQHRLLPRRRGDRAREPLLASHEEIRETDHEWIWQIISHHDVEGVGSE